MLKFIIPAIAIFLIVIFWEKINQKIYENFNIKLNYLILSILVLLIAVIIFLIKN